MKHTSVTPNPRAQVRRVLLITLALNVLIAIGKIVMGAVSGALAVSADGFNSLIDSAGNVAALFANQIADQPADEDHPYGHRRFETIIALMIGVLMLVTAWELVSGALDRLGGGAVPTITPLTFAVMLATLVVNLVLSRYKRAQGKRLNSEVLLADAANTRADVYATLAALIGISLTALGMGWADPIAALLIVGLIVRAGWDVIHPATGILVDRAPFPPEQLSRYAESVPAVSKVLRARSRGSADAAHVDIDVEVPPEMTAEQSAAIADAIRVKVSEELPGVNEVEIHFAPRTDSKPDYALTARAQAAALGMTTHEVRVSEADGGKLMELHVEVAPGQSLAQAHEQVTQLEQDVRAALPDVADVITHIEPAPPTAGDQPTPPDADGLIASALGLLNRELPGVRWHHARLTAHDDGLALALHAALPANLSVEAAHSIAEQGELRLKAALPQLIRVTIHTEPETA